MTTNWLYISNCTIAGTRDALALERIALAYLAARHGGE